MAKKSKSRSGAISSTPIASQRLHDLNKIVTAIRKVSTAKVLSDRLRAIEDRRTFNPAGPKRSARSFNKSHHALVVKKSPAKIRGRSRLPTRVMFDAPKKVLICVRRQRRKEVMFAQKKTGKGGSHRPGRRNFFSDVSC